MSGRKTFDAARVTRFASALLFTTVLTAPAIVHAEAEALDDQGPVALQDVVVTASATGVDLRDAPASISVITREEIERQPVQSIGELLGRLPGVTGGISPTGAMSKITIRGLPDNYTLILVDGRRMGNSRDISYRPDLGRQDLNWISPDMIERIEVVRGPMSSLYGSDAMGGVINIITRRIAPTWRGSANTSYTWDEDSDRGDAYQLGVNVAGPLTETLGLRLGANYSRSNPDEVNISSNNGTSGVVNRSLNGVLTWAPVESHVFSAEAGYGLEQPLAPKTLVPNRNGVLTPQSAFGSETERTNYRVSHEGQWSFGQTRLDIYRNAFVNQAQADSGGTAEFEELIVDGLWSFEKSLVWLHRVAVGAQYREEELTNTSTIGTVPVDYEGNVVDGATLTGDTAALFVEDQITLRESLLLTLGGRLDSHHLYGEHFSPRAYLIWHPADAWSVRGGVSRGFRAPSLKENSAGAATQSGGNGCRGLIGMTARDRNGNVLLDGNGNPIIYTSGGCYMAGNPDLKPEESTSYEFGLSYDGAAYQFSATYFHTDFENKIQYAPLGYFEGRWWTKNENIQRARTKGLELTGLARLPYDLTLRGNATWMIEAENLDTGASLITTPEWTGYASLDWRATERLGLMLSAQYTGEQLSGGSTLTNSHTEFDLSAAFDATEAVTLRAGVSNLFAEKIGGSSGDGYYSPGRRFFVGLTSRF
jgi:outer membrane receptor for ferrienterochelin and colicins